MKTVQKDFQYASEAGTKARVNSTRKPARHKTTRDCPRVTLRLSPDDHERLKDVCALDQPGASVYGHVGLANRST